MCDSEIVINEGRDPIQLNVTNRGDRPIQVGSNYHSRRQSCAELTDRGTGRRLDIIPAGTAVRFELAKRKPLRSSSGGHRIVRGGP